MNRKTKYIKDFKNYTVNEFYSGTWTHDETDEERGAREERETKHLRETDPDIQGNVYPTSRKQLDNYESDKKAKEKKNNIDWATNLIYLLESFINDYDNIDKRYLDKIRHMHAYMSTQISLNSLAKRIEEEGKR